MNSTQATHLIALLHWLRAQYDLTPPYYVHIHQEQCEIGWHSRQRITYLNGESTKPEIWQNAVKQIGDQAARENTKAFGYVGFDAWDNRQGQAPDDSAHFPSIQFFIPQHRLIFKENNLEYLGNNESLAAQLKTFKPSSPQLAVSSCKIDTTFTEQAFLAAITAAKQEFSDDLVKVVLSRYISFTGNTDLLALFQQYCLQQKYADAVLMDFGDVGAAIASPELLVNIKEGLISANPLAGTRTLGESEEENAKIAKSLLCDRKELAEHTLALLQMVRELQPHCKDNTLVVNKLLNIVYQNHIMHLSSELHGWLSDDHHCVDAMLALFPSAMVSGVPKAEAIQLIRRLEGFPRGLFAGTVGWLSGRNCRFALTIRGIYRYGAKLFVQAGAGVMAESEAAQENEEIKMKMAAMLNVLSGQIS